MSTDKPDDIDALKLIIGTLAQFDLPDQQRLLRWADEKLGTGLFRNTTASSSAPSSGTQEQNSEQSSKGQESKTTHAFFTEKNPTSLHDQIACILYFNREYRNQEELDVDDIRKGFIAAKVKPPKALRQALHDCRRRTGYVAPGSGRGKWTLSHDGESRVAVELPSNK